MAFKKGDRGNPHGRPKGVVNKATKEIRDSIKELINEIIANSDFLKNKTDDEKFDMMVKLLPYGCPKPTDVQVTNATESVQPPNVTFISQDMSNNAPTT